MPKDAKGRWNFRSFAMCDCGRYRFHDRLDPETTCLCGRQWPEDDKKKAEWYRWRAGRSSGDHSGEAEGNKDWYNSGAASGASDSSKPTAPEVLLRQLREGAQRGDYSIKGIEGIDLFQAQIEHQPKEQKPQEAARAAERKWKDAVGAFTTSQRQVLRMADEVATLKHKLQEKEKAYQEQKDQLVSRKADCTRASEEYYKCTEKQAEAAAEAAEAQEKEAEAEAAKEGGQRSKRINDNRQKYPETKEEQLVWDEVKHSIQSYTASSGGYFEGQPLVNSAQFVQAMSKMCNLAGQRAKTEEEKKSKPETEQSEVEASPSQRRRLSASAGGSPVRGAKDEEMGGSTGANSQSVLPVLPPLPLSPSSAEAQRQERQRQEELESTLREADARAEAKEKPGL